MRETDQAEEEHMDTLIMAAFEEVGVQRTGSERGGNVRLSEACTLQLKTVFH